MEKVATLELTREQIVQTMDREARRRLGMDAEKFVRTYREGRLSDPGAVADLLALASLLPDTDPLYIAPA